MGYFCSGAPEGSTGCDRRLKRYKRLVHGLKSYPTDWEGRGSKRIKWFIHYTTPARLTFHVFFGIFQLVFTEIYIEDFTGVLPLLQIITIHHELPCRIEISHPRGRKFNQGRGLPSPWLNSDPEGEISLSYMDRLMMDRFSPTFRRVFVRT